MSGAIVAARVFDSAHLAPKSVQVHAFTDDGGLAMEDLDGFLHFERAHERRRDRGRGHVTRLDDVAGEHRARAPLGDELAIGLVHGALVAGTFGGVEHPSDACEAFDGTVDPSPPRRGTRAVREDARFTVVETADDDVSPQEDTETGFVVQILDARVRAHVGVELTHPRDGDGRFRRAFVVVAEEHTAREIALLDDVHVVDEDFTDPGKRQRLQNFVPERARANDENPGRAYPFLIPPGDELLAMVATVGGRSAFDEVAVREFHLLRPQCPPGGDLRLNA